MSKNKRLKPPKQLIFQGIYPVFFGIKQVFFNNYKNKQKTSLILFKPLFYT